MVVVTTSETQRCDNVVTTLFDVATKIQPKPNVVTTSCASWVETHNELTIHQRILQVLMTEIYKIVNGVAPRIMNSLFEFRSNEYNIRNFQVLSTDLRRTVKYGIETMTYRAPSYWAKLPSEYKLADSLTEFNVKVKKWQCDTCS